MIFKGLPEAVSDWLRRSSPGNNRNLEGECPR